jgi:hypothetical protein
MDKDKSEKCVMTFERYLSTRGKRWLHAFMCTSEVKISKIAHYEAKMAQSIKVCVYLCIRFDTWCFPADEEPS